MNVGDLLYEVTLGPNDDKLVTYTHRVERVTARYVWLRHMETDGKPRKYPTMDPRRDREQVERLYSTSHRAAWLRAEHIYTLEVTAAERRLETARKRVAQITEYLANDCVAEVKS